VLNLASKRIYLGQNSAQENFVVPVSGPGSFGFSRPFSVLVRLGKTFPWASCCLSLWLYAASYMVNIFPPTVPSCSRVWLLGSYIFNFLCPPLCQHIFQATLFTSRTTWVAVISGIDSKDNALEQNMSTYPLKFD